MNINIKTSKENQERIRRLTNKFNFGSENIIARIALAYTFRKNLKYTVADADDAKGKEYKEDTLFGNHKSFYIALICQTYGIYKENNDIPKYIKIHLDKGLELIESFFEQNTQYSDFDFLNENIEAGIQGIEWADVNLDHVKNSVQTFEKSYYIEPINIEVGKTIKDGASIDLHFNNSADYNNNHIAVAGNSGTGKTQFALSFLDQLAEKTKGKVNFIYLDFKGLKKEDLNNYKGFFNKTKTTFIDAPQKPFPINPISFIDNVNEKNKIMGINKLVDIIAKYSNIGKNQEQTLKEAIKQCFENRKDGSYPTFPEIYETVLSMVGDKPSTLREILQGMSELELFDKDSTRQSEFLNQNYYLSLSGDLPNSIRFTSVFLVINYIYNIFMNMENSPVENDHRGMRYVLLIDEAHVIFKDKKSQDLLEKILREIRSKGVSVFLLSQGIEEFNQPSFDFSSMCEIAFLLDIKDKTNMRMINKFLGFGENEGIKVKHSMEKIEKGQAISNIKEYKKGELFEIKQYGG